MPSQSADILAKTERFFSIPLSELVSSRKTAASSLIRQLRQNGFALVRIEDLKARSLISAALDSAETMGTFRFPPHEQKPVYSDVNRDCFRILFELTQVCLKALMTEFSPDSPAVNKLLLELRRSKGAQLFVDNPDEPFLKGQEFSGSFFNIFDYDHGFLNTHRDRCLVTAIVVRRPDIHPEKHSTLWVKGVDGEWINADQLVSSGDVIIFVGDDFHELSQEEGSAIPAAEHCIRVNPNSAWLPDSHFRPDPQSLATGNRKSVAFILSDATED